VGCKRWIFSAIECISAVKVTQSRHAGSNFKQGGQGQQSSFLSCNTVRWFWPIPLEIALIVNATSRRHMKFLTSGPNFRGVSWPPWPGLPAPLTQGRSFWFKLKAHTGNRPVCDFLLVSHSNLHPILHCFGDTATYWLKTVNFSHPLSFSARVP